MSENEAQDQAYDQEYQGYEEYAGYQDYQGHTNADSTAQTAGTWIQCFDEETGYPYLYNDVTGETKWVDADASNDLVVTLWQKFYDDNGDEFYYNPHTGESSWELPQDAVLEESNDVGNEDQQFADHEYEENIAYDGEKYIEVHNQSNRQSVTDTGAEAFDLSLEPSLEHIPHGNQLAQSSVHSTRSTKSASYIPMKLLVRKSSGEGLLEKKTSFGNLGGMEKKHSAQSLGIRNGSAFLLNRTPVVKNDLKPHTPQSGKSQLSGFTLLKVGASVLRKQIDENGITWCEYQAADNGPVFYAQEDNNNINNSSKGASAGQWNRPHVFDLDDFSSASIISVEPVDFNQLDDALVSRPSSRQNLHSLVPVAQPAALNDIAPSNSSAKGGAYVPKAKVKITHFKPPEEPKTEERKSLFGSFINSVFVETVAMEENNTKNAKLDVELTLDALGLDEEVEDVTDDDAAEVVTDQTTLTPQAQGERTAERSQMSPAAGLSVTIASPGMLNDLYLGGGLDSGIESPAERIALTPVRKLPPGSGMRKSSFSQLNYIPESQPLFEKEADMNEKSGASTTLPVSGSGNDSPQDTPVILRAKDGVGAGMEAVRAMYLHSGGVMDSVETDSPTSGPRGAVPFQSLPESPDVTKDLFNSLHAESQIAHTPVAAAVPVPDASTAGATSATPEVPQSTNATTTEAAETWIQCYDEESGWPYVYNEVTGEVKWVEPESTEQLLAELWEVCYDEAGNQFYYNAVTGVSSWELPDNAKVAEGGYAGAGAWIDGVEPVTTTGASNDTAIANATPTASAKLATTNDASLVSMKKLTSKASLHSLIEKKTSVGTLTPLAKKDSALNLGIKTGSAWIKSKPPEIKDDLKPTVGTPKVGNSSLRGFALLKVGAKVLDKQIDEDGAVWIQYQAVDKGPVFYAQEGAESAGQWNRPPIYQDGAEDEEDAGSVKATESVEVFSSKDAEPVLVEAAEAEKALVPSTSPPEVVSSSTVPAPQSTAAASAATITDEPAPVPSASLPKVVSVPQLPLEPIISKQLAQTPIVVNIDNALTTHSQSRSQSDSQDPALYELSGLSAHSKPGKGSQVLNDKLSQHSSLAMELKALGLDDDGDFTLPVVAPSPAQTAAEKRKEKVAAKLREYGEQPERAKLMESPYKAKSTEKYPVKVKNLLVSPQKTSDEPEAPIVIITTSSPVKTDTASLSPARDKFQNKVVRRGLSSPYQSTSPNGKAARAAQFGGGDRDRDRESSYGGSLDRLEAADSSYRSQGLHFGLPEYPSPSVGGAVKSSFLTELGFTTASTDMSVYHETYMPPKGVSPQVLMEELERGDKLNTALKQVVSQDQNEDEAAILLRRLQMLATAGGLPPSAGASRPTFAFKEDASEQHAQAMKILERTCLLLERIEESPTEHKVNELQLLEAVLAQRAHLVAPRSLVRDHKTHNSLPVHCCSPQGVKYPQVEHRLEVVADAGAWLLCKDPFFLHGKFFYVNKTTRFVQVGEPLDFTMKKMRQSLCKENWNEFELNLVVNQHRLENAQNELLRDPYGGLLVYNPLDDQYSSTGKFDANYAARARMDTTQQGFAGTAPYNNTYSSTGHLGLGATMNSRTALLMSQSSLPVFTHQRPASASAAAGVRTSRPHSASSTTRGVARSLNNVQDLFRRRSLPKNVWTTLALDADPSVEGPSGKSHFVSDFAALDQTANSFGPGGNDQPENDNFYTLKDAFASNNDEEIMEDRGHAFTSPYFDTEMMLEMTRTQGQTNPQSMLAFERSMDPETYTQYHQRILAVAAEPENPVPLLELMELLVLEGLGKQACAVLKRATAVMENLSQWSLLAHENAVCRLLSIKMASKYFLHFEKPTTMYALVDSFPESPMVLAHVAMYFHSMKYLEQAELLFVGALMLNPHYERALLGYARLLAGKGNYRAALKYLSRIDEESPLWIAAKLDMAGIQEVQGADPAVLLNAYKNCTYQQVLHQDRTFSVAQHCMAIQHHRLHEHDKAEFFFNKALQNHPENSIALVLSAAVAAAALSGSPSSPAAPGGSNNQIRSRPGTAGIAAAEESGGEQRRNTFLSKEAIDAKYRSGVLLLPPHRYRWIAVLGYADFVCCVLQDTHRAEQYYAQAAKLSFSYSIWSTLALAIFHQYVRGEAGVAGRLLLRTLRHRHADVFIDCLTDFNAFKHREEDSDPASEVIKFMSLPSAQPAGEPLREDIDDLEVAALYVVIAYYLMDLQEWDDAMKYAAAAIRISETYSPALRCIALITWQHGNTRKISLRYFAAALEFGRTCPYVLRTCAVVKALEGHHDEAISLMESAVQTGPNCPLAYRALGLMVYLYRRDEAAALAHLTRAFELSNSEDIECLRLRGQILMDGRRFKEARVVFQQALYIVPWDAVCLASLGYCVGMLPSKDSRQHKINSTGSVSYHSRLMSMQSFEDLVHSRDAEELLEASVTIDLQRILAGQANLSPTGSEQYAKMKGKRLANPFGQSNGMVLSNFAVENELEEVDADFGNNMTGYAYYWYGMHELKKGDGASTDKARTLFSLASKVGAQDAASSTSALAMYMLGVLAEREEDIECAERHYVQAVQCEPMEPIALLRLSGLVEEGLANMKRLIRHLENNPVRRKRTKKLKKKSKKETLVDTFGTVSTYRPPPKRPKGTSALMDNLAELLSKPLLGPDDEVDEGHRGQDDSDAMDLDLAEALNDYQRRLLMHQRVHEMVVLKKQAYRKLLSKSLVPNPAHHVFVDSYWLERLLHSFSACEDWATLYRCAQQTKPKRKGKTPSQAKPK